MKTTLPPDDHRAFTFIELIIVIAVLAVLAGLLLPALAKSDDKSKRINCINNLKQDGLAFRLWSGDNGDQYPPSVSTKRGGSKEYVPGGNSFRHFRCLSNELNNPKILVCPADDRKPASNFATLQNSNVSYFVGVDANETMPQMLLAGDRNLTVNGEPVKTGLVSIKSRDSLGWTDGIHNHSGNVALADGSVQAVSDSGAQQLSRHSGTNVSRLAFP